MTTLSRYHDYLVTPSDVKALSREEATLIYLNLYVMRPGFENINDEKLRALVVDCGVLHGPGTVTKWLQSIVEQPVDGIFGVKTAEAVNSEHSHSLYLMLCAKRFRFFGEIITKDPTQAVFAHGWMNRASRVPGRCCVSEQCEERRMAALEVRVKALEVQLIGIRSSH